MVNSSFHFPGKLYLIPTTLGAGNPLEVLPLHIKKIIEHTDDYIVENERTARRAVKNLVSGKKQSLLRIKTLNKFTHAAEIPSLLNPCKEGKNIGLLSEAGCPGIADPGAEIVKLAHQYGIKVVPLVGPSSILLAMMASGMNGQSFSFLGYLPIDKKERKQEMKHLERVSFEKNQAQIFIETPYRNNKLLEDLQQNLHPGTRLCIACDITLPTEIIMTKTIEEWQKTKTDLHKRPAIFIIQKDF